MILICLTFRFPLAGLLNVLKHSCKGKVYKLCKKKLGLMFAQICLFLVSIYVSTNFPIFTMCFVHTEIRQKTAPQPTMVEPSGSRTLVPDACGESGAAWRIIPVGKSGKWLVTPISQLFGRETTRSLGDLPTMVVYHLLLVTGMILQFGAPILVINGLINGFAWDYFTLLARPGRDRAPELHSKS